MDTMCVASKPKSEVSSSTSALRNVNSDEKAQKENADFRQNNNAHLNRVSFIPVYNTKKADTCHYFSDKGDEKKSSLLHGDQNKLKTTNSPSGKQSYHAEQNEKLSLRSLRTHMRRRSVGFEDMTSMNACYISNEKRNEAVIRNSNKTSVPDTVSGKVLNSDNDTNFDLERTNQKELNHLSVYNDNAKVLNNANDKSQETDRPYHHYKDKSSKRKSSLNRMDFIDFPPAYNGKSQNRKSSYRSKDSSSEEELDIKPRQSFESNHSKRKHNVTPTPVNGMYSSQQKIPNEVLQNTSPLTKARLLPKSSHSPHPKFRQHKKTHSATLQLQKLSHSAGELESLTDETNATNKVCLSAQEFDFPDSSGFISRLRTLAGSKNKKYVSHLPPVNRSNSPLKNSDASQHQCITINSDKNSSSAENICRTNAQKTILSSEEKVVENENSCPSALMAAEPILSCMNLNDSFELKHIDSKSEDDLDVADSTAQLQDLNISEDANLENSARLSDDNCDSIGSDGERRPSSILRKKYTEEKKELHSILKPPPEDKSSKTLPSILKHRESSEEKDFWQQSDLHSILKKSTSEDESCNSGPDNIRPILKFSTDEDSPGGGGGGPSSKPRPILKKRTSFSEECCYASYPNGELKPILKKKTPLSNEDQPRPILKSRRKSEDVRSSLSEFIASRPRAYSADMGVKPNHDRLDDVEQKSEDFCKRES